MQNSSNECCKHWFCVMEQRKYSTLGSKLLLRDKLNMGLKWIKKDFFEITAYAKSIGATVFELIDEKIW